MAGRRRKLGWKGQVILTALLITAVVFTPTSIVLLIGMMPTIVASFVDRTPEKTRGMTVGAMNLAGCAPFIIDLWSISNTAESALEIVTNPLSIIVMYVAAGMGYLIDWSVTGIVATFLIEKARARIAAIEKMQGALIERWGLEVAGDIPLDAEGFPVVESADSAAEPSSGSQKGKSD